jgi:hypothetical protein
MLSSPTGRPLGLDELTNAIARARDSESLFAVAVGQSAMLWA